ncbi:hypothetical protein VM98_37835, partial [Streptomyces rubellomurinus subsp. indigoferus]
MVRPLHGEQAAELEDQLKEVFAEAFAEQTYGEGPTDVERAYRRLRSQTRRRGFWASVAFDGDN